MLFVAAVLGIPEAVAESIVSIILGASTLATILVALAGILAGGISAILAEGSWATFVTAVKSIVKKTGSYSSCIMVKVCVIGSKRFILQGAIQKSICAPLQN